MSRTVVVMMALAGVWLACPGRGLAVTIDTAVSAREYTWTITNDGPAPIKQVEIPVYHAYNFRVPDGWTSDGTDGEKAFVATASGSKYHVRPGQTLVLQCGINRAGAGSGSGAVTVHFADDATAPVVIADVTIPAAEPDLSVWLTPVVLVAFFVIVGLLRRRRGGESS